MLPPEAPSTTTPISGSRVASWVAMMPPSEYPMRLIGSALKDRVARDASASRTALQSPSRIMCTSDIRSTVA